MVFREDHKFSNLGLEPFFSQKICPKEIKWRKPLKFLKINLSELSHEDVFSKKTEFHTTFNFNINNHGYVNYNYSDFKYILKNV